MTNDLGARFLNSPYGQTVPVATQPDRTLDDAPALVTVCEAGPLLVRGDFEIVGEDGTRIDPGRATVALCRCGRSAIKPFCDGTHKVAPKRRHRRTGGAVESPDSDAAATVRSVPRP